MDDDVVSVDSPLALQSSSGSARPSTPQVSNNSSGTTSSRIDEPMLMSFSGASMSIMSAPSTNLATAQAAAANRQPPQSKYAQLLAVIEDLGKDIRPTYAGSKSSAERLKRGIVHARILIKSCLQLNTAYCADSVEFCPMKDREHILACGSYQLVPNNDTEDLIQPTKETRIGRLCLFGLETSIEDVEVVGNIQLKTIQEINMPGILDMKWCPNTFSGIQMMAVADASGAIGLYRLVDVDHDVISVIDVASMDNDQSDDVLALSLDWSSAKHSSPMICMSDSTGSLWVKAVDATGLRQMATWKAHEFEAWIVAFDSSDENIIYSGGDDAKLKGWDLRQSTRTPTFISKKHTMGVTSIHSNSSETNFLATGSYDERVLIWDRRHMTIPIQDVAVGGGVWRLKWMPESGNYLLAACMHGGARVLHLVSDDILVTKAAYSEHDSMVYGIDWCRRSFNSMSPLNITVATCSFYDKALHLWEFEQ